VRLSALQEPVNVKIFFDEYPPHWSGFAGMLAEKEHNVNKY